MVFWAGLTDINERTKVLIEIAHFFHLDGIERELTHIQYINSLFGYLPTIAINRRRELRARIYNIIEKTYGERTLKQILNVL